MALSDQIEIYVNGVFCAKLFLKKFKLLIEERLRENDIPEDLRIVNEKILKVLKEKGF